MSKYTSIGLTIALAFLTAAVAFASDGHAEGEQSPEMNLFWRLLNIAVFVGVLYKLVGNKAKAFFSGRRDGIRAELADLEAKKTEAERHLAEIKERIVNLYAEREAILKESKAQAEQLRAVILSEAHKQAEQVREQALRAAENEGKAAMEQLRAALADEIVAAAEALLQSKLDGA